MGKMSRLADNLAVVKTKVSEAARRSGRSIDSIEIMAVTKTLPEEAVKEAYEAGLRLFGENRLQEAIAKYADKPSDLRLHLIGHLQRNKAKLAVRTVTCVESIDKIETASVLARLCSESDTPMEVLIEFNTSGEDSKFGVKDEDELFRVLDAIQKLSILRIRGLMTIGPFTNDDMRIRQAFALLKNLFERIHDSWHIADFDTLSMGMSGDYEKAVEEGATRIRIGTALFGPRSDG